MMDNTRRWDKDFTAHWERVPLKSKFSLGKGLSIKKTDLTEEGENVISYGQIHAKWNSKVHCHDELIRHTPKAFCDGNNSSIAIRNGFIFADTSEDLDGVGNAYPQHAGKQQRRHGRRQVGQRQALGEEGHQSRQGTGAEEFHHHEGQGVHVG